MIGWSETVSCRAVDLGHTNLYVYNTVSPVRSQVWGRKQHAQLARVACLLPSRIRKDIGKKRQGACGERHCYGRADHLEDTFPMVHVERKSRQIKGNTISEELS